MNNISPRRPPKDEPKHFKQDSGDLYRLLVERVQDYAIFALDPSGYVITWNTGAERLKGYRPEEIIGKHFSIFFPPEDVVAGKPQRELELAAKQERIEDNGWRMRKDGTRFWANVLLTAIRDDDGNLIGFAKVTRDLTAQRLAEIELKASEERFRLMVQSVRDYAIFMLDPTGHIATWNEGAERLKGYKPSEIIGKHFSIFYPKEDLEGGKPDRELRIATSEGKYEEEGWRLRKDGSRFWAHVILTAIHDSSGKLAGFAKVTRDLTERRASEERALEAARRIAKEESERAAAEQRTKELRELADQLHAQAEEIEARRLEAENANRAKAEFLAAMSHELRTPLNAISGYTQLMQLGISGPLTREQAEQLERIQRSQAHLLGIINDILNFSRIEAGHLAYEISEVPVRETMDSVLAMVAPQAAKKEVNLDLGECDRDIVAMADRPKVEQILLNLLSNAVKFTDAGGRIEMSCDADDSRLRVRVWDNGIGIPADQLETIFAPFAQVGRSLASPKEGTGLGLSISRDLARGMNGELTVESKVDAGSTFTLELPRAKQP